MRLLHTSDWHLGHRLHGVLREREHARFLRWLVDQCVSEAVDALVIAGDVFDTANPPAEAQRAYYQFLAACLRRRPQLQIVVIGGNHDSPARLDAAAEVLRPLRVHILGGLPRDEVGTLDKERATIPLHDHTGAVAAWLVAVPYLRPIDWPAAPPIEGAAASEPATTRQLLAGLRGVYDQLFARARLQKRPGQALIAAGHCLLAGGAVSLDSERRIQLGNSLPLPCDIFPSDFAYVALGHLHKAQQLSPADGASASAHIRYSGSPIPLSFAEIDYPHQVVLVDFDGENLREVRPILVPRSRPLLCVPPQPLPIDEVLPLLRALPRSEPGAEKERAERPLLEVRVRLTPGELRPNLRPEIEEALTGARAQLLRIVCPPPTEANSPALTDAETPLLDLQPEDVFVRLFQRASDDPAAIVPATQMALFRQLVEQVESGLEDGASMGPGGAP